MKYISILIVLFVLFFSLNCQKDAVISTKDYPYVLTHEIVHSDSTGTTLKGEIFGSNKESVIEYGFVWGTGHTPTLDDFKYTFYENDFTGIFQKKITYDLILLSKYNARAYAKIKSSVIYGNIISFSSQGSSIPIIDDFYPETASDGDTIIVNGQNFSSKVKDIKVLIGSKNAIIDSVSNNYLRIIIPPFISSGTHNIIVETRDKTGVSKKNINISNPVIESFIPNEGFDYTTVEIKGNFFSPEISNNIVLFGNAEARILKATDKTLTVISPMTEVVGPVRITVYASGKSIKSSANFKILGPTIDSISPTSGKPDDVISITGQNFDNHIEVNKIYFDDLEAKVISGSTNNLKVKVPKFYNGEANISINVTYKKSTYHKPFTVFSPWSPISSFPGEARFQALAINLGNKAYFGTGRISNLFTDIAHNDLWEYNINNNTWTYLDTIPGGPRYLAIGFAIGDKLYIGTGSCKTSIYEDPCYDDFWEFNPKNKEWNKKTNVPGGPRNKAIGFSVGGKGYVGYGNNNLGTDLWEYNPNNDNWVKVPSIEIQTHLKPYVFVLNSKVFIGIGRELWLFNPLDYSWVRRSNFPNDSDPNEATAFSIGGKGYVGYGDFWEYDPVIDKWASAPSHFKLVRIRSVGFSNGKTGFIGTGIGFDKFGNPYNLNDFWKFEPEK